MNISRRLLTGTAAILAWLPLTVIAQNSEPPHPRYHSAQRPYQPPLPFNPMPELPVFDLGDGLFVFDDTEVDYGLLTTTSSSPPMPGEGSGGDGGTNYLPATVPVPGVPLLVIKVFDGAKIISFNTITGLVYRVEATTNLNSGVWTTIREFVATETNASITIEDQAMAFYRVFQEDDTIQFPDWFDSIYQYLRFDVYTTITNGIYRMELYADGELVFSSTTNIPPSGRFSVHDPTYDPADWPNTGYYSVGAWELRVAVTGAAGSEIALATTTHRIVKKNGVQRNPFGTYTGMTVGQGGIFSTTTTAQDEVDQALHFCMKMMYNACEIVDWNFSYVDVPATDSSHMTPHATLFNTNHWNPLRRWITRQTPSNTLSGNTLDYFHYMGHGSPKALGNKAGELITLGQLQGSPFLQTNFMTYAALDGCRTLEDKDFIKALVGYGSTVSRTRLALNGQDPHFGCGWNNVKSVQWVLQGVKNDNHFWFWEDFYFFLTRRDISGLMFTQYKEAYRLAKDPMGQGVNNTLQTNPEANGFVMVGCDDCRFDERPGIVQ